MDDDILTAIIAKLLATSAITAIVGSRIWPADDVPPIDPSTGEAPAFPRGYIEQLRPRTGVVRYIGNVQRDEEQMFRVIWASTSEMGATAKKVVQSLDALAASALDNTLVVANLSSFLRDRGAPMRPQVAGERTYFYAASDYCAKRQYN